MEHSNPTERRVSFALSASQEAAAERHETQPHRPPLRRLIKLEECEEDDDYEPDTPPINKQQQQQQQQHKHNQAATTAKLWSWWWVLVAIGIVIAFYFVFSFATEKADETETETLVFPLRLSTSLPPA